MLPVETHHRAKGTQIENEENEINNVTLYLKQLEKEEMKNPRVSRRKEIIKIKAEINEKERRL